MRPIPKSRIQENLYTNGTGFGKNILLRFPDTKKPYIGFYTVISGAKYYSGKEYVESSQLLEQYTIPINSSAVASAGSIPTLAAVSISGIILSGNENSSSSSSPIRYFYKDLTSPDNLIKQIDKKAYDQLSDKLSNTYQVISYNKNTQTLEEANKQMPGLAAFLGT
jgi:hypothetical protein